MCRFHRSYDATIVDQGLIVGIEEIIAKFTLKKITKKNKKIPKFTHESSDMCTGSQILQS